MVPKVKKLQGNESFQRMNYLYQIGKMYAGSNNGLSGYYGNLLINIAKKNVLKIHPDIKRTICKKCRSILVENKSATKKIKIISNDKFIIWTCNVCKTQKRLPIPKTKDNRVWVQKPEAVVETLHYKSNKTEEIVPKCNESES